MTRHLEGFRAQFHDQLITIHSFLERNNSYDRRMLMALNASVQHLIDEVAKTRSLKDSITAGFDLLSNQIADLKSQLATIAPGQPIDEENLAAINKAADDLDQTNEALKVAVPAEPKPTPTNQPLTSGTQPVTHDAAGNPIAPDADGQPKHPDV